MPASTRSSSRIASAKNAPTLQSNTNDSPDMTAKPSTARKRKADSTLAKETKKIAKPDGVAASGPANSSISNIPPVIDTPENSFVPAVLTFDFEKAKKHLIQVDHRFEDVFSKMACKPFEELEQLHPYRALATSILGQQISWLAARSITHKFIRLFDPSLPENPTDEERKAITFFPAPAQVAKANLETLRTAGLSGRKAEYVQDLAARFADGRLSTQKLLEADDDELAQMLIEVRGIGRWTVDMFAIFSLRRPDILPTGDLGVQRGVVRWFLSLHSPNYRFCLSPEKVARSPAKKVKKSTKTTDDVLPSITDTQSEEDLGIGSSVLPAALPGTENLASLPPTFTPSINKTLDKGSNAGEGSEPIPLPSGLDVKELKSRLDGKKKIKGAFLTPQEMTDLTECWKPYRSIGVYYMWSLADAE